MNCNETITDQFMSNKEFRGVVLDAMMREVYGRVRQEAPSGVAPAPSPMGGAPCRAT